MKCLTENFDFNKTWILLTAGKKNRSDFNLEKRILNSLMFQVSAYEPQNCEHIYGRVADILLFEDIDIITEYRGIGNSSICRIRDIRSYLNGKNIYRGIFSRIDTPAKPETNQNSEVNNVISFGDMKDKQKTEKLDKEYSVYINGYDASESNKGYISKTFAANLTDEEAAGIRKIFDIIQHSDMRYITGMGVCLK